MSFDETLLRVPISSSGPQRPQLLSCSAAELMSSRVTLPSAVFVIGYPTLVAYMFNLPDMIDPSTHDVAQDDDRGSDRHFGFRSFDHESPSP